ncbi:DMT family transporter [Paenibacillus sp. JX-17]|uniref:DMT family transporter n=1 Tax=Paenibacillus lacisoli TaxID=3064525 RepID=A0ABT9CI06_9BACL|nr:DMT family transporter [Paenibacillus sp. JX-17]MDO7908913.1 DMT family transporter [Paenibacillus sp. JX-17]
MIAIFTGALLSLEGALYGKLGEQVGSLEADFYNFFMGAVISLILLIFFGKGNLSQITKFPKWNLVGGVLGVVYLLTLVIGVPIVGVGISMIAIVVGQMVTSMMIDHFGWLGSGRKRIGSKRVAALILMLGALVLTLF